MNQPNDDRIRAALAILDTDNDDNWTGDGLPKVEAVNNISRLRSIRSDITNAAPKFTRETAKEHQDDYTVEPIKEDPIEQPMQPDVEVKEYDDILLVDMELIIKDQVMMQRLIDALNEQHQDLTNQRRTINEKMKKVAGQSVVATTIFGRVFGDGHNKDNGSAAFLKASQASREKRAASAKAFIEAGTNIKDVTQQLNLKSPIDTALGHRKPAPSSLRPAVKIPQ